MVTYIKQYWESFKCRIREKREDLPLFWKRKLLKTKLVNEYTFKGSSSVRHCLPALVICSSCLHVFVTLTGWKSDYDMSDTQIKMLFVVGQLNICCLPFFKWTVMVWTKLVLCSQIWAFIESGILDDFFKLKRQIRKKFHVDPPLDMEIKFHTYGTSSDMADSLCLWLCNFTWSYVKASLFVF